MTCTIDPAALLDRRLDNGLRVLLLADHRLPLVAIDVWYHVGSRHDPPGRTGLAHLFEHMLFQGSANVGPNEHFARVQQVGGVANGSTWYDRTNYYETLPAGALELGLWLESDRMGFLLEALDQDKLELQRGVVSNERRQRVDNQPYGAASERLNELLYPDGHPYGWPVIGRMEDIQAATLEDTRSFFATHYAPRNATLALVGDFEPAVALEAVGRYFGDLPEQADGAVDLEARLPGVDVQRPARRNAPEHALLVDEVATARVSLAWSVDGYASELWFSSQIVAAVLAEGKASRLEQRLVRQLELATSVNAYVLPTECCATFAITASARPDVCAERVRAAIEEVIEELRRDGCEPSEVERVLACARADHRWALQTIQARADAIARDATYLDDPTHLASFEQRLAEAAGEARLRSALREIDPQAAVGVSVVPKSADPGTRGAST